MSNLIVIPNEVDGWDIVRSDDPQALTNTPTKTYVIALLGLLLAISVIIVITSLLASATRLTEPPGLRLLVYAPAR